MTTSISTRFIEPLDILYLRGNQLFGDPGSYGESQMPPWPSVAAGALRSRILADDGVDLSAFANGDLQHPELGSPAQPGSFVLQAFYLARQHAGKVEILLPAPADLIIQLEKEGKHAALAHALTPTALHPKISSSSPLPLLPILVQPQRSKAASGWWLRQTGWQKYLQGQIPASDDLIHASALWGFDERVGVGLSNATRSAEDGKLFTARAVAVKPGTGFMAIVAGASVPDTGLLRFGGDGRAARLSNAAVELPQPDYAAISQQKHCRIVLTSPGLFTQGWLPNGTSANGSGRWQFNLHGVQGQLVAASVARNETLSGWDLARGQPKPAQRVAPAGSVYWLHDVEASPDALRKLVACGLWSESCEDAQRRAEGFNRIAIAACGSTI